jgi:hypothetical protein
VAGERRQRRPLTWRSRPNGTAPAWTAPTPGSTMPGSQAAMQLRGDPPRRFDDIQIMEREFLAIMSQQRAKAPQGSRSNPIPSTREKISHG